MVNKRDALENSLLQSDWLMQWSINCLAMPEHFVSRNDGLERSCKVTNEQQNWAYHNAISPMLSFPNLGE